MHQKFFVKYQVAKYYSLGLLVLLLFIFNFVAVDVSRAAEKEITIGPDAPDTGKIIMGIPGSKVGIGGDPGAYNLYVNGTMNVTGAISSNVSMTSLINAANVSSGNFGSNTGGGNYGFGISPRVKLDVSGGGNSYGTNIYGMWTPDGNSLIRNWALNDGPNNFGGDYTYVSDAAMGANVMRYSSPNNWRNSQWIPVDITKTYKVSVWCRSVSGTAYNYLSLTQAKYDLSDFGNGGWGHPYFVGYTYFPTTWTQYTMTIGPAGSGAGYTWYPETRYVQLGALMIYGGSGVVDMTGYKIEEVPSTLQGGTTALGNLVVNGSLGVGTSPSYQLDVSGNGAFRSGDNSYLYFGPNASWAGNLYVGATSNKSGTNTAQAIATDGNLHLDAGTNGKAIYMNYYSTGNGVTIFGPTSLNSYQIHSLGAPTAGSDAATKSYVDSSMGSATDSSKVAKSGDTMSGALLMNGNNISLLDGRLYLRTNGDTNHYLWNNDSDWEELVAYSGSGFKVTSSGGLNMMTINGSSGATSFSGTVTAPTFSGNLSGTASNSDTVDSLHAESFSRKDTTGQWIKPYYEYGNYLTSESPATLRDQMGGGGLRVDFMHPSYTANGQWGQSLTFSGYQYYGMFQLVGGGYSSTGASLAFRNERNAGENTWNPWRTVIDSSTIGSQSVNYANSAGSAPANGGNSDSVDGMHFSWSNRSNGPTYVWAADSYGDSYLSYVPAMSVNYANSAGSAGNSDTVDGYHASGLLKWNTWDSGNYYQTNGDIYMGWAGNWLSNVLGGKAGLWSDVNFSRVRISGGSNGGPAMENQINFQVSATPTAQISAVKNDGNDLTSLNFRNIDGGYNLRDRMVIDASGNVGIGMYPGGYNLDVNGSVHAASFTYSSDRSLKTNINTIQDPLAKIMQLRGVTFNWKKDNSPSVGVIAQEVETVFPELVSESGGIKSVQYGNLVAPLIEAVKQQQTEIAGQNDKIDNLNSTVLSLSNQLKEMQKRINKK